MPMIIEGNSYTDQRGNVRFVNDFEFENVKRFYIITHSDIDVVRAWQGHQKETKYLYVAKGAFSVNWIKIDNWAKPSEELEIYNKTITDRKSEILIIPPGHVNGFKALESDSSLIIFSDRTLQESKDDDFRFPLDYWAFQI